MAELADVEQALVNAITVRFQTAGLTSTGGVPGAVQICRGPPSNAFLVQARAAGLVVVGVYGASDPSRNTTRWAVQAAVLPAAQSLTVSGTGNTATFYGIAASGDLAGVRVASQTYIYQTQAGDAAALVAAALADAIRATTICWLNGATITVPGAVNITARTNSLISSLDEWTRQEQGFHISILAPSPGLRDLVAGTIGQTLAQISFLTLADGSGGRVRYRSTQNLDGDQAASVYRREMIYDIEYGTTVVTYNPAMLFGNLEFNGITTVI